MTHIRAQTASLVSLVTLAAVIASCVRPIIEPGPNSGIAVKSDRLGWYTKKVVAKRAPETLLADDGTICRVAPDRFRDTATGTAVYCNWQ